MNKFVLWFTIFTSQTRRAGYVIVRAQYTGNLQEKMRGKIVRIILISMFVMIVIALFLLGRNIYTYSWIVSERPSDAAIVLGTEVWGSEPSPVFKERINHAVELYQTGIIENIIFTGGVTEGNEFAESEVGRMYAIENGVAEEDIQVETKSISTCENLLEAKKIVDQEGFRQVLIVSDPIHMRRAIWIAEKIGLDAEPSPTQTSRYQSFWTKTSFLAREMYFYATYLLQINVCENN